MDYKKEKQIRLRVESIFNKTEDEFDSKREWDDYLEEREDIIFNLIEGTDVKEMEAKIEDYRRNNAESIIRNEAKKAEALRQRAAEEADAGVAGPEREDVSGTAAAFHSGQDAEPHQGMEYTARMPPGAAMAPPPQGAAVPLAPVPSGADLARPSGEQTKDQWRAMAEASGWTPEFQKKKALEAAFGSMFISLGAGG